MNVRTIPSIAIAIALITTASVPAHGQDVLGETGVKGAGSTFAYPIMARWSQEYRDWLSRGGEFPTANAGLDDPLTSSTLQYESIGSLAGALRVKDRAVDFGASDMPLTSEELATLGLGQFPIVIGGVVVAFNIGSLGTGSLRLTGPVVADIFLGKITRWSDEAIKALNPRLRLPDAEIVVVHRSDGSGTTFNFTDYLSKVSPEWKLKAGSGLVVRWPVGTEARGNEGVAQAVQQTENSIGYVEYAQAVQSRLSYALLQNRAGSFVRPETASFQAAAASADWNATRDFYLLLTDVPGANAYPITATVFVLMQKAAPTNRNAAALDFFRWSLERGSKTASELGYVPLPEPLIKQVMGYWTNVFAAR